VLKAACSGSVGGAESHLGIMPYLALIGNAPASLDGVAKPRSEDEESAVRELARRLRAGYADA